MAQPFGVYVDDGQRYGLAEALLRKGYEVSTREHGGWGGGTEWVVRRWRTRYHVLFGRVLPILIVFSALFSGNAVTGLMAATPGVILFFLYGLPLFSADFMWWDSPSENEWNASYMGATDEFEAVAQVIEAESGRKVRRGSST
jgi:hypothetical protein